MTITLYSHDGVKYGNRFLRLPGRYLYSYPAMKIQSQKHSCHFNEFLVNLMVTVLLRRNLAGLLHSTGAKKPNETNKTVVLLQICVEKITKAAE